MKKMKIAVAHFTMLALLLCACRNTTKIPASLCNGDLLESLGIEVQAEENRAFSFTDKHSGYFYATTHQTDPENWFAGWNIARNRILQDYALWAGDELLGRQNAQVKVYPHKVLRRYREAREQLFLFDELSAIGIQIDSCSEKTIGIALTGDLCREIKRDGHGMWFQPKEDTANIVLLCPWKAEKPAFRDNMLTVPATAGGFLLIHGKDAPEVLAVLEKLRNEGAQLLDQRACRMEALARQAMPQSGDPELDPALAWLALTLDQLITRQLGWGIYAGLPWFNDYWGRDMFITLPGACLVNGQFEIARKILLSFAQFQDKDPDSRYFGRIPNRARPDDIIYNTADGTPRFVIQIGEYVRYSGDTAIIRELYPAIERSIAGALRYWTDERGYLCHDDADTWMDAKKKGVEPFSPRGNRANDIQALWIGQLRTAAHFAGFMGDQKNQKTWSELAQKAALQFANDYFLPDKGYLADRLDAQGRKDAKLRPNQLFALDLLQDPGQRLQITKTVWEQLVYPWGVASLSQLDPDFYPYHENWHYYHKDAAYHNGTIWLWNNGIAMQRMIEAGQPEIAWQLFERMNRQALQEGAVGSLSENADALPRDGAARGKISGTFLQAWSNAEQIRVWQQYFLGLQPDALEQRIRIAPRLPENEKQVRTSMRYAAGSMEMAFERRDMGATYEYTLQGVSATLEADFPGFESFQRRLTSGQTLLLQVEENQVTAQLLQGKKILETFTVAPSEEKRTEQARAAQLFRNTGFCQPFLQPGLKSLSVYHDPPLTY